MPTQALVVVFVVLQPATDPWVERGLTMLDARSHLLRRVILHHCPSSSVLLGFLSTHARAVPVHYCKPTLRFRLVIVKLAYETLNLPT